MSRVELHRNPLLADIDTTRNQLSLWSLTPLYYANFTTEATLQQKLSVYVGDDHHAREDYMRDTVTAMQGVTARS